MERSITADPDAKDAIEERMDNAGPIPAAGWKYIFGRALREFTRDGGMDMAAALTYRTVFAIFPALLAVVSTLGLFGQGEETTKLLLNTIKDVGSPEMAKVLEEPITGLTEGSGAGLFFVIGVLGAVWTSSNYVNAFSRSINTVYGVEEGRAAMFLRIQMYLITLALLFGAMICILLLLVSGDFASMIGGWIGLGPEAVTVWNILKWPVLIVVAIVMIGLLYNFTPNVRRPQVRWITLGATFALVAMALATAGFAWYLSNFANYNKTYGSIGGAIAGLMWIWIINCVLVLGAEVDVEAQRARQLTAGLEAEEQVLLPPRSTSGIKKKEKAYAKDVYEGRKLRAMTNPIGPEPVDPRRKKNRLKALASIGGVVAVLSMIRSASQTPPEDAEPSSDTDSSKK